MLADDPTSPSFPLDLYKSFSSFFLYNLEIFDHTDIRAAAITAERTDADVE